MAPSAPFEYHLLFQAYREERPSHGVAKDTFRPVTMDRPADSRLSDACRREHRSADAARDSPALDHLMEPASLQLQLRGSQDRGAAEPQEVMLPSTFWSSICEEASALFRLLRWNVKSASNEQRQDSSGADPSQLQQMHPVRYLTFFAVALTGIWGWRAGRSVERVIAARYSDIAYQIRRPDALSARITAFKVLVLGGLVLPGSAVAVASWQSTLKSSCLGKLRRGAQETCGAQPEQEASLPHAGMSLAETLPLPMQGEMRRLAASFHSGLRAFIEAVTPSKHRWQRWASGVRASHIAGLKRPSEVGDRIATWDFSDSAS
ncbi:hypothetical protein Emag_000359 [Eimeria magna]